jgi:hypothetical protein
MNDPAKLKAKRANKPLTVTTWWAACESGHGFWSGPDRNNYDDATADAREHDKNVHSGVETAVVLDDGP